jgi:hypothetical protein
MGLINRDKDVSEQKEVINVSWPALATGLTIVVWQAPYPCTVVDCRIGAVGLSGSPTIAFQTNRFIAGTGITVLTGIAGTYTELALGTSGPFQASLQAAGSSLLALQQGDVITIQTGGANAAIASVALQLVVKKTQDILQVNNVST